MRIAPIVFGRELTARALLLVQRPDRYRFRIVDPAGTLLFDVLWIEGRSFATRIGPDGAPHAIGSADQRFIPGRELARALLHRFDGTPLDHAGCVVLTERSTIQSELCFAPSPPPSDLFVVSRERIWRDGDPAVEIRYGGYRPVGGASTLLAHRIVFLARGDRELLRIDLERYTLAPQIPPGAFSP